MAKFLNTSKAYAEIEDIVDKASRRVVLISPYIKIPAPLLDRLRHIDRKNIKIVVVCRKDDLKDEARDDLKQLRNLELHFDDNLHAKCFYNEQSMVITSLNLHEYSQQNNREMGILLSSKDDSIFVEALNEAEFIVSNAERDSAVRSVLNGVVKEAKSIVYSAIEDDSGQTSRTRTTRRTSKAGFCIRCGTPIPHNIDHPLCYEHFKVWEQYEDPDYPEKVCHTCGRPAPTSMAKPECTSCYRSGR